MADCGAVANSSQLENNKDDWRPLSIVCSHTREDSRKSFKKNGLETTSKNIAKTWFVLGEKAKYFDICIESGKEASLESADNALIAMKNWNGVNNLKLIKIRPS